MPSAMTSMIYLHFVWKKDLFFLKLPHDKFIELEISS